MTDPTPLQERIERILAEHPIQPPTYAGDYPIAVKRKRTAARIAGEVAAEVQAARIEAWQEGVNFALPNAETTWYPQHNPYRTTGHETGGPDMTVHPIVAMAAAEHRAARAEEQSAIRGRAVVIYRERAREAEAEVKRLSWKCGHLADKYDTDTEELRQEVDQAEARIEAVEDVLSHHPYGGPEQEDAIRRALGAALTGPPARPEGDPR